MRRLTDDITAAVQRAQPEPEDEPAEAGEEGADEAEEAAAGAGIQRSEFGEGGEKYNLKTSSIMSETAFSSLPLSTQTAQARAQSPSQ